MYSDNIAMQKQTRPFVYIQYPNNGNASTRHQQTTNDIPSYDQRPYQQTLLDSPSSTSSSSNSSILSPPLLQSQQSQSSLQPQSPSQQLVEEQPKKKKRQHVGYACDK